MEAMVNNKDQWGELAVMQLQTIRRLEMADVLLRIKDQNEGLVDDELRLVGENVRHGHQA